MAQAIIRQKSAVGENLTVIRRAKAHEIKTKIEKKKVAAYCRVSKDIEEQETSIQTQMESYNRTISEHPDWELAGIYADKGKPGTDMTKRPQFQQMVSDAKMGKIDLILVKSISRFARNTVDLLKVSRELRARNVGIFFEKEKLNSLSQNSEMLMTVYAAFAQEESHSISENMKRGMRERFEMGVPKWANVYGYERTEKDEWTPKRGEAETVIEIFELFFSGKGVKQIAEILNGRDTPPPGGGQQWMNSSVMDILNNEKYIGDCRMQKYYKPDFMKKGSVKNTEMVVNQYYKMEHHEALVPREYLDYVPLVTTMRDSKRGAVQYPYYGRLICPFCGKLMVKVRFPAGGNTNGWVCGGQGKSKFYKSRTECKPYWIKDPYLSTSVKNAVLALDPEEVPLEVIRYLLKAQKRFEEGGNVEFIDLARLVESMTFPDWETLEITWIWGEKTTTAYSAAGYMEAPDPIEKVKRAIANEEKQITDWTVKEIEERTENTRSIIMKTKIIVDERPGYPPTIESGYKPRKKTKRKSKSSEEEKVNED